MVNNDEDILIKDLNLDKVKEIESYYKEYGVGYGEVSFFRYDELLTKKIDDKLTDIKLGLFISFSMTLMFSVLFVMFITDNFTFNELNILRLSVELFFLCCLLVSVIVLVINKRRYNFYKKNRYNIMLKLAYCYLNLPVKDKYDKDDNRITTLYSFISQEENLDKVLSKINDCTIEDFFRALCEIYNINIIPVLTSSDKLFIMLKNNYISLDEVEQFFKEDLKRKYNNYINKNSYKVLLNKDK